MKLHSHIVMDAHGDARTFNRESEVEVRKAMERFEIA